MAKIIIGIMGPGTGATPEDIEQAENLGKLIAEAGWVVLTGGRNVGVMEAASKGAQQAGGLTVGILPSENNHDASQYVDIPICTGMGSGRNNINVLSSDIVIALGSGAGTTSEIMLALKAQKPLILLHPSEKLVNFIADLPYSRPQIATSENQIVEMIQELV